MRTLVWLTVCVLLDVVARGVAQKDGEARLDFWNGDQGPGRGQWHRKTWVGGRSLLQAESLGSGASTGQNDTCLLKLNYKAILIEGNTGYYLSNFALGNVSSSTNVTSWKLGVTFSDGDFIRDAAEVLGTDVKLLQNGTNAIFGSTNESYISEENPVSFNFVQSIGQNATRPLPVQNVFFNNLICELGRTDGQAVESSSSQPKGDLVELTYLPVQYRNRTFSGSQFVFQLKNVQEYSSIKLEDLKVNYYFHGLDNPPEIVLKDPADFFEASCRTNNASTLDCSGVNVEILPGYQNVSGAQFIIQITFDEDSGQLLPQPDGRGDIFIPGGFDSSSQVNREIFIALQPNAFAGFALNDTLDYSYEDTPEVQNSLSGDYIQRHFEENIKMTAYFQDTRIWGIPPAPEPEAPAINFTSYVCSNGTQCEFTAEYCCRLIDPCDTNISSTVPQVWPSSPRDDTNRTCPDGTILNDTDLGDKFNPFDSSSSSIAWVIGLVVGLSCGIVLVGIGIYFWRSRRITGIQSKDNDSGTDANTYGFDMPDAGELSWVIPIHTRLGGSEVPTSETTVTPLSSRQSSALLTNNALTVDSKLMRTVDSRGNRSGTTDMGSPKSPKPSPSPIVPGYMGVALLPPNVNRFIEYKCETVSGRIHGYSFTGQNDMYGGESQDDESSITSGQVDDFEAFVIEDWQLQRSKSWDGQLTALESDSKDAAKKIRERRESKKAGLGTLPPLAPTQMPMMGDEVAANIDLHVPASSIEKHLGKCLGTGGFGAVYKGKYKGMDVAVKKLPSFVKLSSGQDDGGQAAYEALIREIKLASKFDCDRLVKVYGACTDDKNKCCLIMELMNGGNLYQRIHDRNRRRITYIEILQIVNDIAEGLAYLHPFVIHRDLKPQNILMDEEGRAKIADFGISKVKDPSKSYLTQMTAENGTPMYMSPEQMNGGKVDEKVDVYALGCIMNEMWTRRQPWKNTNHFFQIILKVAVNGDRPWMDPETPEPLKRLIKKCWHQDPHQRPSCAEILRRTDILIREELEKWDTLRTSEFSSTSKSSSRVSKISSEKS